jgi:hypothetical protein
MLLIFGKRTARLRPSVGDVKESQAVLDLIFWIWVDLYQKGMRQDRGALDRALVFVVSPSIQDSVDVRCRFRRGLARTFTQHTCHMHM